MTAHAPRILVLGASGRLGRELVRALATWADVLPGGRRPGAPILADLDDPRSLRAALERAVPACVVNAAGATDVDAVERDPDATRRANVLGPATLAAECARRSIPFVHWSSDYVFGGAGPAPRREDDLPAPVNAYGEQKRAAEEGVRAAGGSHLILRTAWLFARGVPGWLDKMIATLDAGGVLPGVADQHGSPTWTRTAADACSRALRRIAGIGPDGDLGAREASGTYHVVSRDGATWYEVACALRDHLGRGAVRPSTRAERGAPAPRPADTRLDSSRFTARFGLPLPAWREALAQCLSDARR
jgi:dTDP-4-dehydrorhamnose reductase